MGPDFGLIMLCGVGLFGHHNNIASFLLPMTVVHSAHVGLVGGYVLVLIERVSLVFWQVFRMSVRTVSVCSCV